ncbi:putative NIF3-like protein 1 [Legionella beliardensis]|uniref:GTP cyclohydrolase 1 type 2 homolog n=1 Tax=Legionella beliardensis TaxID=91822 RepID=A0A378I0Y5_9GAMM|nr:Nif3-like dinuclear metal center hexameric protein [Legionella beliardensis]STX28643.1 putative NIF3-like protein 1 [Legionella beliardensis]
MILRQELVSYIDKLLACSNFNDYAPNGLQIEGKETITSIATAVTASKRVIEEASTLQVDALLVHHGFFWRGENPTIIGMKRARIADLLAANINLFAYHLPLDCHIELGNNACLGQLLGLQEINQHCVQNTANLLWSGAFALNKTREEVSTLLTEQLRQKPIHVAGTDKSIKTIAWCSGAAQDFIEQAHALGVDAYISGEISERTFYQAQELGIHYFACGHHATERYGIQALGNHLAAQFTLTHQFIDSENFV